MPKLPPNKIVIYLILFQFWHLFQWHCDGKFKIQSITNRKLLAAQENTYKTFCVKKYKFRLELVNKQMIILYRTLTSLAICFINKQINNCFLVIKLAMHWLNPRLKLIIINFNARLFFSLVFLLIYFFPTNTFSILFITYIWT